MGLDWRRKDMIPIKIEPWSGAVLTAFLATLIVFGAYSASIYQPLTFLVGDGPYYALTAVSLLYDHDLDLSNQLRGGLEVHGPQIALGRHGEILPKHPLLLPCLALPFLALFGTSGFLLFNLLVLATLAATMTRLALLYAPPRAAAAGALVLLFGTFACAYAYNLSPDLLATLLVTLGCTDLLRGRDSRAGGFLGAVVLAKVFLIVLLPIAVAGALARRGARGGLRLAAGAALPLLLFAAQNAILFGSPLVTSYDRNVRIESGRAIETSHRSQFDNPLLAGLRGELFDLRHGLLPTAPALLLAIPGLVLLHRRRSPDALLLAGMGALLLLLTATYRDWDKSHYGNRFLMPLLAFATPAVALTCEELLLRARRMPGWLRRASPPAPAST